VRAVLRLSLPLVLAAAFAPASARAQDGEPTGWTIARLGVGGGYLVDSIHRTVPGFPAVDGRRTGGTFDADALVAARVVPLVGIGLAGSLTLAPHPSLTFEGHTDPEGRVALLLAGGPAITAELPFLRGATATLFGGYARMSIARELTRPPSTGFALGLTADLPLYEGRFLAVRAGFRLTQAFVSTDEDFLYFTMHERHVVTAAALLLVVGTR
jgi:hypothetical protein